VGTKNNPGVWDCYKNAEPDEPMFVLLGRDPMAGTLVRLWADLREARNEDPKKVQEARDCAKKMDEWARARGKLPADYPPEYYERLDAIRRTLQMAYEAGTLKR
jgi:hypothetical protein